jgi:CRISPR-associated protein Cas1
MLVGRLGLETARLPHADRHGLISLDRGRLTVEDGCLTFDCAGGGGTPAGRYGLPHQSVSLVLLGPGSTVSHDALRLLARHGVGLAAVGEDGVRFYTAPPLLPDFSYLARAQTRFWADELRGRLMVARRMYALRLGEVLPHRDIAVMRGIEGARMKETYRIAAERAGIRWNGRRYDRQNPNAADRPNQALNHAASAVEGAAAIASTRSTFAESLRNMPSIITRCERMFRLGRMRPAHARSSVSETLLRTRSLAGYIIGTLESRFRKRQVIRRDRD